MSTNTLSVTSDAMETSADAMAASGRKDVATSDDKKAPEAYETHCRLPMEVNNCGDDDDEEEEVDGGGCEFHASHIAVAYIPAIVSLSNRKDIMVDVCVVGIVVQVELESDLKARDRLLVIQPVQTDRGNWKDLVPITVRVNDLIHYIY
jgi:hypothetical protein